jgi:hypothetical protein
MNNDDLRWLAGWLEGEGCFSICRYGPEIAAASTDEDVAREVATLFGVAVSGPHTNGDGNKPIWRTTLRSTRAADLMRQLLPAMRGQRRRKKIEWVLKRWDSFPLTEVSS